MNIEFEAKLVSCDEALGGDIIQVSFQQDATETMYDSTDVDEVLDNMSKFLSLSINYEFPPSKPSVEWFDGEEINGSSQISHYKIDKTHFELHLENNINFHVSCTIEEDIINTIHNIMKNI